MLASKRENGRIPWTLLGIEALLIVLSVLLALGLNGWRESRTHHDLAVRSIQGLVDEFDQNCERIRQFHSYHQAVAEGERESTGIQVGLIRNDAWESARSAGAAVYIEYEVTETIGRIYASQGDHRTIMQSYMQALFGGLGEVEDLRAMHGQLDVVVIRELVRIQEKLLEQYAVLKEAIDRYYRGEVDAGGLCA